MTKALQTAVLVCGDWQPSSELEEVLPYTDARPKVISGLCTHPEEIRNELSGKGFQRLVLGLCSDHHSLADVQQEARKVDIDPLGIEIVQLEGTSLDKAKVIMAAAVERAKAFVGSKPENAKPYISSRLSRRSLLRFRFSEYRAVPSIDEEACTAWEGCNICAQACPRGALEWSQGVMAYDKAKCDSCGVCVTACPRGAIINPSCTPNQMEAYVRTLLPAESPTRPGIVYLCPHSTPPSGEEDWLPVVLPSTAMATPSWLLAPLIMGAGSVAVMTCPKGCPRKLSQLVEDNVAFCQDYLRQLGALEHLVAFGSELPRKPQSGIPRGRGTSHFGPAATAGVLLNIAVSCGKTEFKMDHPDSPLGLIHIFQACTACGMCAQSCPTGALTHTQEGGIVLTFDARLCVACGLCLSRCPERESGAIVLLRTVDLERLSEGKRVLHTEGSATCVACGAPIAPLSMVKRVEEMLGNGYAAVMPIVTQYCSDCRVLASSG